MHLLRGLQLWICIISGIIAVFLIIANGSILIISVFGAIPVAILIANVVMSSGIPLEEYSLHMSKLADSKTVGEFATMSVNMVNDYLSVRKSLEDIIYINYSDTTVLSEFKTMIELCDENMMFCVKKIYSRMIVSNASNSFEEEDLKYFKENYDKGVIVIKAVKSLLNEIPELNNKEYSVKKVADYIEALRSMKE